MGGDWSTGLFGCFADPGSFCLAMCGWPFLVGKISDLLWPFIILHDARWPLDDLILRKERRSNWWRWNTLGIIGLVMLHEFPFEKPNQKEARWSPFNDPITTLNNLWTNIPGKIKIMISGIEGRFAFDFLIHFFCGCCAIAQGMFSLIYDSCMSQ